MGAEAGNDITAREFYAELAGIRREMSDYHARMLQAMAGLRADVMESIAVVKERDAARPCPEHQRRLSEAEGRLEGLSRENRLAVAVAALLAAGLTGAAALLSRLPGGGSGNP